MKAEEALFIDDNIRNVDAAKHVGLNAILFKSPSQLLEDLSAKGIDLK
ncbi:MAG: hypothetical protein WKG06_06550 [Segetibacter sp.]